MNFLNKTDFRNALGRFATGITVVTMRTPPTGVPTGAPTGAKQGPVSSSASHNGSGNGGSSGGAVHGITVNAFMSVSLEPMLIGIAIDKRAQAHHTLSVTDRFAVSVLSEAQQHLSDRFAGRPVPSMADPFTELAGFPVIAGAITQIVARKHSAVEGGDHTIFIGAVERLRYSDGKPLLYFRGDYGSLSEPEPDELESVEAEALETELLEVAL